MNPFNGEEIDPSLETVKLLGEKISSAEIITYALPVVFRKCVEKLIEVIGKERPDVVIRLELGDGYSGIAVERVAINVMDNMTKDNEDQVHTYAIIQCMAFSII